MEREPPGRADRVNRLDWIVLPPLVLAFFALQLDRGNM